MNELTGNPTPTDVNVVNKSLDVNIINWPVEQTSKDVRITNWPEDTVKNVNVVNQPEVPFWTTIIEIITGLGSIAALIISIVSLQVSNKSLQKVYDDQIFDDSGRVRSGLEDIERRFNTINMSVYNLINYDTTKEKRDEMLSNLEDTWQSLRTLMSSNRYLQKNANMSKGLQQFKDLVNREITYTKIYDDKYHNVGGCHTGAMSSLTTWYRYQFDDPKDTAVLNDLLKQIKDSNDGLSK